MHREARAILGLIGAQSISWGALDVLVVVLAFEVLGTGASGVGFLNSALGAGGLIGGVATIALVGRRRLAPAIGVGILAWAIPIAVLGRSPGPMVAGVLLATAGAGHSVMDVPEHTLLQRIVPDHLRTRTFGIEEAVYTGGLAVGALVAPALSAALGLDGALLAAGLLLPVAALAVRPRIRRADDLASIPTQGIELLQPNPIFAPLPWPVLERLASELVPTPVAAGMEVIREGEPGDCFYVVELGRLEVLRCGRVIRTLGPGDSFGEIALLRTVPRTATVVATTDCRLHTLRRDPFLEAVTGHPVSRRTAEGIATDRLGESRDDPT
jgi:MFS family permease